MPFTQTHCCSSPLLSCPVPIICVRHCVFQLLSNDDGTNINRTPVIGSMAYAGEDFMHGHKIQFRRFAKLGHR